MMTQSVVSRHQRGFSMLELLVAGVLILILVTVSYRQYMAIVVDAEQAAFNGVRGWLQAGLNMTLSEALVGDQRIDLAKLEGSNPMRLLESVMEPPSNYLGELSAADTEQAEPGSWYFDTEQRALFYRFRYRKAMNGFEQASNDRVGFRLVFGQKSSASGTSSANSGRMLQLKFVEPNGAILPD